MPAKAAELVAHLVGASEWSVIWFDVTADTELGLRFCYCGWEAARDPGVSWRPLTGLHSVLEQHFADALGMEGDVAAPAPARLLVAVSRENTFATVAPSRAARLAQF